MIGRVLNNRYRLISLLGEGGMAVVYEASDLLLDRKVAVKLLRQQFATDPAFLARFQREAKAAAGLSHPNVVAIYDVGTDADVQYIVMEMVEGRTLKEIIEAEAPLSTARIVDIGRQICEGLEYAHQHRIVHRDVKPQNILVTRDGRAKIADFGIAVALGASSLTEAGFVVGSAHYFSPEQAQGDPTTAYSDIYSTGVVLYEMATGRLPFQGETSVTVAMKQVQEQPVPPRTLNPRIPESLQTVILQAMAKDSEERFGSGVEMAEALLSCARAGMEATRPHAVVTPRHQDPRGQENKKETLPRQSHPPGRPRPLVQWPCPPLPGGAVGPVAGWSSWSYSRHFSAPWAPYRWAFWPTPTGCWAGCSRGKAPRRRSRPHRPWSASAPPSSPQGPRRLE